MNIKKQTLPNKTLVLVSGIIDEQANFSQIGPLSGDVEFSCKEVSKINSNGVKSWISYFTNLSSQVNLSFSNLSPVLVEQLNSLTNFCAGSRVESLMVPFADRKSVV